MRFSLVIFGTAACVDRYLPAGVGDAEGVRIDDSCHGTGVLIDPFLIGPFPYVDHRDTTGAPDEIDRYACAPTTDEGGGEWWYRVDLAEAGTLSAKIDEIAGDGIDVDVHLLDAADPDACLDRDHVEITADLEPGTYFLVVDTYVSRGVAQDGPYTLTVDFAPAPTGSCATVPTDLEMVWSSCASGIDCYSSGSARYLRTPATGPVVKEAHLVTTEDGFGSSWPSSSRDRIADHYASTEATTGYTMARTEAWAPAGEGGSRYGQGATGAKIPVEDEAFYVTMSWRTRPVPGTRMIVRNRANGRAVVASAGWETGPGANTAIAGVTEEIHDWLDSDHLTRLEVGFAADPTLPLGPIDCE